MSGLSQATKKRLERTKWHPFCFKLMTKQQSKELKEWVRDNLKGEYYLEQINLRFSFDAHDTANLVRVKEHKDMVLMKLTWASYEA